MQTDRRSFLKGIATAATLSVIPATAEASESVREPLPDAVGMLYDTTKCIGCKACVVKCKEVGGLPADTDGYGEGRYDAPEDLNEYTRNIIKLFKGDEGITSYVKRQCMHCVDPACTNACMLSALQKSKWGVVTYDANRCVGCRYCQVACPFNIPKFQWSDLDSKIVKCDFCIDRLEQGREPGCTEVCPRDAVIFGKRAELLEEARRRLKEKPDLYVQKIYGEHDLGGTQVLYISHVPFEDLGFRFSDEGSVPARQRSIQHGIYQGFAAPIALYAILGAVMVRNRKKASSDESRDEQD